MFHDYTLEKLSHEDQHIGIVRDQMGNQVSVLVITEAGWYFWSDVDHCQDIPDFDANVSELVGLPKVITYTIVVLDGGRHVEEMTTKTDDDVHAATMLLLQKHPKLKVMIKRGEEIEAIVTLP